MDTTVEVMISSIGRYTKKGYHEKCWLEIHIMSFLESNGQQFPNTVLTNNFTSRILPYRRCIRPLSRYLYVMGKKIETSKIIVTRGIVKKINGHLYYGML